MRVRWTRPALAQLAAMQDYLAGDSPTAAHHLVRTIRAAVRPLADFPAMGRPGRVAEPRELVVNRGRQVVAYRVQGHTVAIIAVLDARREWPEAFDA